MRTKPVVPDEWLLACLRDDYGVAAPRLEYLPLGADFAAWAYRVEAEDGEAYFLKLRKGTVDVASVLLPRALRAAGVDAVVAPLAPAQAGQLWATVADYTALLYPYIPGGTAMEHDLTEQQWIEYGAALRQIHAVRLPDELRQRIPRETFIPAWSQGVRALQTTVEQFDQRDRFVLELAAIWQAQHDRISEVVARAEALGRRLRGRHGAFAVCHTDIHLANVLVDPAGRLRIVDWDAPLQAPKERDLHFLVGSVIGRVPIGPNEEALFFRGYGPATLDWDALTYYRYEWVSGDLLAYGQQVCLVEDASEESKEHALDRTRRLFAPGRALDSAFTLERRRPHRG